MITMPNIDIIFKQKSASLIERSQRGYSILIVRDDTDKTFNYKEYNMLTDVDEADYTSINYQYIKDIFVFAPYKLCVVRIDATGDPAPTMADALAIVLENVKTGWITIADGTENDFTLLTSWIKGQVANKKTYKAIVYNATVAPDEKYIVNFVNEKVTFVDSRGEETGLAYCPSICGILASCNILRGSTYYKCSNLMKVTEVANRDTALQAGKFILFNEGNSVVRVAQGINSMTTTNGETATEDMKLIENVEVMTLIMDDINTTFKEYIGHKNKYDDQILLISSINGYFRDLGDESVLDSEYDNKSDINVEEQRQAWIASGKTEASNWSDTQVRKTTYKRSVYLEASIKILGSMTDLKFTINLF